MRCRGVTKFVLLAAVLVCLQVSPLFASLEPPYIDGTSTATFVVGGPLDGWWLYEMDIEWNLTNNGGGSLSHFDLIFNTGCPTASEPSNFALFTGQSTGEDYPDDPTAVDWTGYFQIGDPSLDPEITNPILKYNEYTEDPGITGYGTFTFYSIAEPKTGIFDDALVAKDGIATPDIYGNLSGDVPSCTVPEPATVCLLGLGALGLIRRKKIS